MTVSSLIRVLLIDDHTKVRQSVRDLLCSYPNIEVIGEAGDGEEGLSQVRKLQPSVVVTDISMPKMDGVAATRLIKTRYPHMAVVGLSVHAQDYHMDAMIRAGACEVIAKEKAGNELYGAIQRAVASVQPLFVPDEAADSARPSRRE